MSTINSYQTSINRATAYWMARIAKAVYLKKSDNTPDETAILTDLQTEDAEFASVFSTIRNCAQAALIEHKIYF